VTRFDEGAMNLVLVKRNNILTGRLGIGLL